MPSDPEVWIVGGDSVIGGALAQRFRAEGITPRLTSRRADSGALRLDLAEAPEHWTLPTGPALVYLCAGVTGIAPCESAPAETARINVDAMLTLAERLLALGGRVVFPSSSLVLDGSRAFAPADSPVHPLCAYAAQKAAVETALLSMGDRAAIVRMTKILPPAWPLLQGWLDSLGQGKAIQPFDNLWMSPVPLAELAEAMFQVGMKGGGGLYQVSGDKDLSYAEAARLLAKAHGLPQDLIQPVSVEASRLGLSQLPRYTTLDASRLEREFGLKPSDVERCFL